MLILRLRALAALSSLSLLGFAVSMCGDSKEQSRPAVVEGVAKLTVSASPSKLAADGTTTDITILASQEDGTNGNGSVTLQATNGSLDGGGSTLTVALANGRASVKWNCDAAAKATCIGSQTVTATWAAKTATTTVEFTAGTTVPDAGTSDAMANADTGLPIDAASEASTDSGADASDAATVQGTLAVAASKPKIYLSTADFSNITATLKQLDGGPIANEPVTFATDLGTFGTDGGAMATANVITASNGTAQIPLRENGATGTAVVTATRPATNQTATVSVAMMEGKTLTYDTTKCGLIACTIMGVKSSGFNESANVSFKVVDAESKPVPGLTVSFALANAPTGTTTTATGVTDAQGVVFTTVTSGPTIGSFNVVASFNTPAGLVTTQSATIGIRGAIPTNKAFTFSCSRVNIDAYNAPSPPRITTVTCNLKLLDRYNNPVGTGTSVNFKSEVGGIESSKVTQGYNSAPGANNTAEGTGTVTFSTDGDFPAVNTTPLVSLPTQFPKARTAEPSWLDGAIVRNPRDGLVALIAYVQGEEYFSDDNSNGTWNAGEQFIDQGEPFVDSNDNGVWDAGETRLDPNNNGVWDGPNGVWNSNTTIWAETHVLYTDKPSAVNSFITPATFPKLALGASQAFSAFFRDLNLNYISKQEAVLGTDQAGTRTLNVLVTQNFIDDYGMGMSRMLVASPGEGECASTTPVCKHKTLFTWWPGATSGSSVDVTFTNPSAVSPNGGSATCRIKATEGGTTLILESTGTTAPP